MTRTLIVFQSTNRTYFRVTSFHLRGCPRPRNTLVEKERIELQILDFADWLLLSKHSAGHAIVVLLFA